MIPPGDIQKVLEATDILALVQSYVKLRRSGKEWFGLCPFHAEQTPSFTVNPHKQAFLCRGCLKGGNAIGFVMEVEHVRFPEAVRILADRAGITLTDKPEDDANAYARQLAAECRWYVEMIRYRFAVRHARQVTYRNLATRRANELYEDEARARVYIRLAGRYRQSAGRWERIINRLDSSPKARLLARYVGIRHRHPRVASQYATARDLEAACANLESRAADVLGNLSEERFNGLVDLIATGIGRLTPSRRKTEGMPLTPSRRKTEGMPQPTPNQECLAPFPDGLRLPR